MTKIKANQSRMIDNFRLLARTSSVSGHEIEVFMVIDGILHSLFELIGISSDVDNAHIKASKGGVGNRILVVEATKGFEDLDPIGFVAHVDTVDDEGIHTEPIVENGIIHTGEKTILGADDKAGVCAILEMLFLLFENNLPHGPIIIVFTVGEEAGMYGSLNVDLQKLGGCRNFYVFDGDMPNKIYRGGVGKDKYEAIFEGVSAHAGLNPEDGKSAILAAANGIQRIMDRCLHGKMWVGEQLLWHNISFISGGFESSTNVVPDKCCVRGEIRFWSAEEATLLINQIESLYGRGAEIFGCDFHFNVKRPYDPVILPKDHKLVVKASSAIKEVIDQPVYIDMMPGGSDANGLYMASNGEIKSVILGCGMRKPHSKDEYLILDELFQAAEIALELAIAK